MDYLEKFQLLIESNQPAEFMTIWEEFCLNDVVDGEELVKILNLIKKSSLETFFGPLVETIFPLLEKMDEGEIKDEVLRLMLDLQTTDSVILADIALDFLTKKYSQEKHFNEGIRIVGLRKKRDFKFAIRNYEFLSHFKKGNFVFHQGGWGVGEIMDSSFLQEHVLVDFEGVLSQKELSFEKAFKILSPLSSEHFLARRFGNPDEFESFTRKNPVETIFILLRDLGPKTAQEIKDELCGLVIPDTDWSKWWQLARNKIKKDSRLVFPKNAKIGFCLNDKGYSHFSQFKNSFKENKEDNYDFFLVLIYNFVRDFLYSCKEEEVRDFLRDKLLELSSIELEHEAKKNALLIQCYLLLEEIGDDSHKQNLIDLIKRDQHIEVTLDFIHIVAFKKSALILVKKYKENWGELFLKILFLINFTITRDYIFRELKNSKEMQEVLKNKILELVRLPTIWPEVFFWFFQKLGTKDDGIFCSEDMSIKRKFLEGSLILLHHISNDQKYKDLGKKMHMFLIGQRFLVIRKIIEGASLEYLKEFLLLSSKCPQFNKNEISILHSLAEVIQPCLKNICVIEDENILWTTQEGFQKARERLLSLSGVETIENAKEIEAARALGDLRENSEYKFSLEKRARIQEDIKNISIQMNRARILTKEDIDTKKVGVGCRVSLLDDTGKESQYTLLGPWDADVDKNILSMQSKFAIAMRDLKEKDTFSFQNKSYTIKKIQGIFE